MAKEKKTVPQIIQENTPEGKTIIFEYIRKRPMKKPAKETAKKADKKADEKEDKKSEKKNEKANRRIGVFVSTGNGTYGWSLCKAPKVVLLEEKEYGETEMAANIGEGGLEVIADDREKFELGENDKLIYTFGTYRVSEGDKFNFERAIKRALKVEKMIAEGETIELPRSIQEQAAAMVERSKRYFKQEQAAAE